MTPRRLATAAAAFVAAALLAGAAAAGDRPFAATASAAAEEDDDGVWSVEVVGTRLGALRGIAVAPEYAFSPTDSVQAEFGWVRDRNTRRGGQAVELEWKHLFNRIGRDGYGFGLVGAVSAGREQGSGWRADALELRGAVTLALGDDGALLHLNAGVEKPRRDPRVWAHSAAMEGPVAARTTAFAELAREGGQRLMHAGVRHWLRRERLALDFSLQRLRGGGERASGWLVGIGWYDL